jgi:hypothetical protein
MLRFFSTSIPGTSARKVIEDAVSSTSMADLPINVEKICAKGDLCRALSSSTSALKTAPPPEPLAAGAQTSKLRTSCWTVSSARVSSFIGVDEATPPLSGVLVEEAFSLLGKSWNARAGAKLCTTTAMESSSAGAKENFRRECMLVGIGLMSEKRREIERADL